jgi:hypothetical protein
VSCVVKVAGQGSWVRRGTDLERSDAVRFGTGRIMDLRRAEFRTEMIAGAGALALTEMPRGDLYLTEDLVDSIRSTGQSAGTDFVLVQG